MNNHHLTPLVSHRVRLLAVAMFAVGACLLPSDDAQAQTIASFNISVSSSEMVLAFPDDPMVMHFQAWDSPLTRLVERNMPFVEVTNTSTAGVNLTDFRLTIGDELYNFTDEILGDFAVLGSTTPNMSIVSASAGGMGDDANVLNVMFGNGGLAPGETIRFQVDINPDETNTDAFIHPDFRSVFFDIVSNSADSDARDNSVATGVFSIPNDPVPRDVSRRFQDFVTTDQVFINEIIRPYSIMEGIEIFDAPIPEPTSVTLLALASVGLVTVSRRRR